MVPKLYSFQEDAKAKLRRGYCSLDRLILCLPTGAGKTFAACSIVRDAMAKEGAKLILVDRAELMDQWVKSLSEFEITHRLIRSRQFADSFYPAKVYVGMVESVWGRMKKDPKYLDKLNIKFVILDECHKHAFHKILQVYQGKALGLTATPLSSNDKVPLRAYYDKLIIPVETPDLIMSGRIVGARTFSIEHDWTGLKQKANGEYDEEAQMEHFGQRVLYDGLVEHWKRYALNKQTIIYNVNIEHSKITTNRFCKAGFAFAHLDGTMSISERNHILNRFRRGELQGLCNVHLLTTGNDEREVECIGLNRRIGLVSTFTQIVGRGARAHTWPDGRKKRNFVCLDMGSNHEKHGVFGERIDWNAIYDRPGSAKEEAGVRLQGSSVCRDCCGVNPTSLSKCVYCEAELAKPRMKGNFSEMIKASPSKLKLIKQSKQDRLPAHLKGKKPSTMTTEELREWIDCMGYKQSYFHVIMKYKRK